TVTDDLATPALTATSWTAEAATGSTVDGTATANGTGPLVDVPVVLAPGGTVIFTIQATVDPNWLGGDILNTAVGTPGANTECDPSEPSCSPTTILPTPSPITIVKTHTPNDPEPTPGEAVTYRVVVTNLSPFQGANTTVSDPLPTGLEATTAVWTTSTTGTGTTVAPVSGTGSIDAVAAVLGPEGTVTFTLTATIDPSFPGGTALTNIATATPGEGTSCLGGGPSCTGTETFTSCEDGDPTCSATATFDPTPDPAPIDITKTVAPGFTTFRPGSPIAFVVTVTNASAVVTGHGTVTDPVAAGLVGESWTASASTGSSVVPATGSGALSGAVVIAAGGAVTFTVRATIDPHFDADFDIDNVATFAPGTDAVCRFQTPGAACNANAVLDVPVLAAAMTPLAGAAAPPSSGSLAYTGAPINLEGLLALLLVAGGSMLLLATQQRRRRRRSSQVPPMSTPGRSASQSG
ncbi:MAG TPA: hypothetical protein VHW47_06355, partial [Acidimicrobiales bacterium]|nr:hypothetical protein [Acidimicrobiales bacterium]